MPDLSNHETTSNQHLLKAEAEEQRPGFMKRRTKR